MPRPSLPTSRLGCQAATTGELAKAVEDMNERLKRLEEGDGQGVLQKLFGRRAQPST